MIDDRATDALVDSYQAERRPIARQIIDLSLDNARARSGYRIDDELLLTASYRSPALIARPNAPDRAPLDPLGHHQINGPGDRAPGIESTLDLLGPDFTPLTASDHPVWQHQVATVAAAGIPITARAVNTGSQHEAGPHRWHTRCGIPQPEPSWAAPMATSPGPHPTHPKIRMQNFSVFCAASSRAADHRPDR